MKEILLIMDHSLSALPKAGGTCSIRCVASPSFSWRHRRNRM